MLEVAGEELESVTGVTRMVCNSDLALDDVVTARAAAAALRQEWCRAQPEALVESGGEPARQRFTRLHEFLVRGKLQVRVLPDECFGLVHGKAGVMTLRDGAKTSFLGSVNESKAAWQLNYELLWEDTSADAVAWVQEEFDVLWQHHAAIPLAEFVLEDMARISRRRVIRSWAPGRDSSGIRRAAAAAPVSSRRPCIASTSGCGSIRSSSSKLAFEAHRTEPGGARFVLADQVGLGKTVQLAMAAELMAPVRR